MGWKGEALGKDSPENHGITEPVSREEFLKINGRNGSKL